MSAGQFTKCLHSKERSAPLLRRRRRRRTAFALVRFGIPRRTDIDEYRVLTYFHDLIPRYTDILAFSEDRTSVPDKKCFQLTVARVQFEIGYTSEPASVAHVDDLFAFKLTGSTCH